ncbi:MAG TPA: iron ABC transporter permease [Polyangiaceae bacterium]|nr:iron ABC transporter permease [Polyangiaceae bacterium]
MSRRVVALGLASLVLTAVAALVGPSLAGAQGDFILWQLRVPRVLVGALVGGTLGLVGACFQTLFANPLASESTVGTTAGATLGALAALALALPGGFPTVFACSCLGAGLASVAVTLVAGSGRATMGDVLLAGITVTVATGALSVGLQYLSDSRALVAASRWALGQLPQVGYDGVLVLAPVTVPCWLLLLTRTRALQTFTFGEELAESRGVNVPSLRRLVLAVGSLGVGACVAWCGPIAFVGLIVPHVVRRMVGAELRRVLPLSLLSGAAFLVLCDALSRSLSPGRELPVGVVTAALGAPGLVLLLLRTRRSAAA